jgi:hypothetical protein
MFRIIGTHAETPTKEVKVGAADLSQLTIQDRKVVSVRVVGVALFIKLEEVEGETGKPLPAPRLKRTWWAAATRPSPRPSGGNAAEDAAAQQIGDNFIY